MASKLIIGCGYVGLRVALRWVNSDDRIFVLTRRRERVSELGKLGLEPLVADLADPRSLNQLHELGPLKATLYAVGYDAAGGSPRSQVIVDGLQAALDALADVGKLIFISTTGVYAQSHGEWVDEQSPCEPKREAGQVALAAEWTLAAHRLGSRAVVLRLAGIYGPGRIPYLRDIRAGAPIVAAPDGYLNLIHVDDAVEAILAAEQRAEPPALYLVSDGQPMTRREYAAQLANLLDVAPPIFQTPSADVLAASRGGSDKRISNRRLISDLDPPLDRRPYVERLKTNCGLTRFL